MKKHKYHMEDLEDNHIEHYNSKTEEKAFFQA